MDDDHIELGKAFSRKHRDAAIKILEPGSVMARRVLVDRLVNLPGHAGFLRSNAPGIPRSTKLRAIEKIENLAQRLSDALSGTTSKSAHPELKEALAALMLWEHARALSPTRPETAIRDGRARDRMRQHARAIAFTTGAARQAANELRAQTATGRGGARHEVDRAIDSVVEYLMIAYRLVRNEVPTGSASAHSADGADSRFLRFAKLCFDGLGWKLTKTAIRERFRRIERARRKHEALASGRRSTKKAR